jgi:hypothetical protein
LGLIASILPSRTCTSDPQCTEHSLQVLGTIFNSPGAAAVWALLMVRHRMPPMQR